MPEIQPYPISAGVEAAIKDAAKKAAVADPSLDTNERIRLEYFNRFLSRIFSEGDSTEWVLKGGTGMLARADRLATSTFIARATRWTSLSMTFGAWLRSTWATTSCFSTSVTKSRWEARSSPIPRATRCRSISSSAAAARTF